MIEQVFKIVFENLTGIWLIWGVVQLVFALSFWYYSGLKTQDEKKIGRNRFIMILILLLLFILPFSYFNYYKSIPLDEQLDYMIFEDSLQYNRWIKEVEFELGFPRYPRRLKSNKIYRAEKSSEIVHMRKHHNPMEKRVFCNIRKQIPIFLLNENAEAEYRFIKASHLDLEEIGFINDSNTLKKQTVFHIKVPKIDDSITFNKSFEPKIDSSKRQRYMEFNSYFIAELRKNNVNRNSYIMDYGSSYKQNRISIYLGKNDTLFYRIIDNFGKTYIVSMVHNLFDKRYQYFFRYGIQKNNSYIEVNINGISVFKKSFNYSIPFNGNGNKIFYGSNIDGAYASKQLIFYFNMYVILSGKRSNLMNLNFQNPNSLLITKDMINIMFDEEQKINLNNMEEDDFELIKVK